LEALPIDVWVWQLEVPAGERARLTRFLSADELQRAERFVTARDRERFVVARGGMREILAHEVGISPGKIEFHYTKHGKPELIPPAIFFNLSHSQNRAALAISSGCEVGIDIEAIRPLKEDIAANYFSRGEIAELDGLPPDDRLAGFYRCWTRKEAVLKALGEGLSRPLDSFEVSIALELPARLNRMEDEGNAAENWQLATIDVGAGFAGALASQTNGRSLEIRYRSAQ
jgi:4'-phosphopantetheinyl transferase